MNIPFSDKQKKGKNYNNIKRMVKIVKNNQ